MKLGKDLLIDEKWLENTIIYKGIAQELYEKSPNPLLKRYIDEFKYTPEDAEQIQKLINYTVVTYIKTDKEKNLLNNVRRWKYTNKTVREYKESYPTHQFNTNSFDRMKDELIAMLFE